MMRWMLLPLVMVFFAGCSLKPKVHTAPQKMRLEPYMRTVKAENASTNVLKVSTPYGLRALQSTNIIYTKGDGVYQEYRDHKWEDTPARQLQRLLSTFLQESGYFAHAISAPSKIKYDYLLESRIDAFEHHVEGGRSFIRLHVNLFLVEGLKKRVVGSMQFKQDEPTQTVDAKGMTKAFNHALGALNEAMLSWLKEMRDAQAF